MENLKKKKSLFPITQIIAIVSTPEMRALTGTELGQE